MRAILIVWLFFLLSVANATAAISHDKGPKPPGYLFVTGWYKDENLKQAYYKAVTPVLRQYGFEGAISGHEGKNLRMLEGGWIPGRILLIRFSSEENVKRFWWSKEYEKAKAIRAPASVLDIAQVTGVPGATPLMNSNSAYLVFYVDIADRDRFRKDYEPAARQLMKRHGGQLLIDAARTHVELLEGTLLNARLMILEFPSVDSMIAFWSDPEYQRLGDIRRAVGVWSIAEITPKQVK